MFPRRRNCKATKKQSAPIVPYKSCQGSRRKSQLSAVCDSLFFWGLTSVGSIFPYNNQGAKRQSVSSAFSVARPSSTATTSSEDWLFEGKRSTSPIDRQRFRDYVPSYVPNGCVYSPVTHSPQQHYLSPFPFSTFGSVPSMLPPMEHGERHFLHSSVGLSTSIPGVASQVQYQRTIENSLPQHALDVSIFHKRMNNGLYAGLHNPSERHNQPPVKTPHAPAPSARQPRRFNPNPALHSLPKSQSDLETTWTRPYEASTNSSSVEEPEGEEAWWEVNHGRREYRPATTEPINEPLARHQLRHLMAHSPINGAFKTTSAAPGSIPDDDDSPFARLHAIADVSLQQASI